MRFIVDASATALKGLVHGVITPESFWYHWLSVPTNKKEPRECMVQTRGD